MTLLLIAFIVIFLIFFYIITFLKLKKRRSKKINVVTEYRQQYMERKKNIKNGIVPESKENIDGYHYYVTKYNSQVDYIEKDSVIINDITTIR